MGSDAGALEAPLLAVVDAAAPAAPRPSSHGAAVANLVATAVGAGLLALPKVSSAAFLSCQSKQKTANHPANQSLTDNYQNEH